MTDDAEPTFVICVGATKAGTSWLYQQMSAHPDCYFRTIKELHYFNTLQAGRCDYLQRKLTKERRQLNDKLEGAKPLQKWRLRRRIVDLRQWAEVLGHGRENLAAYSDYLVAKRGSRRVVGEVTPAYATLPTETLHRMATMADDVRIVYLMRDPVARFWSHVRMLAAREVKKASQFEQVAVARFEDMLANDPLCGGRGDYASALAKLGEAVAPERLLVMFNEDLITAPGMVRFWEFLGLAPKAANLDRHVHQGRPLAMTPDQRSRALAALMPQYKSVSAAFPVLPEAWRKSMEEVA